MFGILGRQGKGKSLANPHPSGVIDRAKRGDHRVRLVWVDGVLDQKFHQGIAASGNDVLGHRGDQIRNG